LAASTALTPPWSPPAWAAPSADKKRVVLVLAQGGWDTTWVLDPKRASSVVDVPQGTPERFDALEVFTDPSRPNVSEYFRKHASVTAVVRGVAVASVSHPECVKRMSTGTRVETNPDLAAIVAHHHGNDLPLPYLVLGDVAFTGPYAASAGRVGETNQIVTLLDPAQAFPVKGQELMGLSASEDALLERYQRASLERLRQTRGSQGYNKRMLDDFQASIVRAQKLVAARAGFGRRGRALRLEDQADLALDAMEQGIAQSLMLSTRVGWDSHDTLAEQGEFNETALFPGLTRLVTGLRARPGLRPGTKMIDDTLVVVYSEFTRTPKLNARGGKDHWPVGAAMLVGGGVRGGRAFGATSDRMEPVTVDFATGQPSAGGRVPSYANLTAGLLELCGVLAAPYVQAEAFHAFRA
jgi:hypothetical protein